MQLNTYVERHIPAECRSNISYIGNKLGFAWTLNELLDRLEQEKLYSLGLVKEVGFEVEDNFWVTVPTDFREVLDMYYPPIVYYREKEIKYAHELVNGKIKLFVPLEKKESPDTFTLSAGSTTQISINDTDATLDLWKDYLLVLTDGAYSGDTIYIKGNAVVGGGVSVCDFLHTQGATIDSTAGYLTDIFFMLKYRSVFTHVDAEDDEIPIDDNHENICKNWFIFNSLPMNDKRRKQYQGEFEDNIVRCHTDQDTPSVNQLRPRPRPLAGYSNVALTDSDTGEYIGEV